MLGLAILIYPVQTHAAPFQVRDTLADSHTWTPMEDGNRHRQSPGRSTSAPILPDLRTMPPSDISLVVDPNTGRKSIRFSNSVWNAGPGALEVHGNLDAQSETISVLQVIHQENGNQITRPAGEFHYHADHGHMHWHGFSLYQIWSVHPDGGFERVRASSDKVGYCLRDIAPYNTSNITGYMLNPADTPGQPGYTSCSWHRQGLSVGWYDVYHAHISGQSLDINHLEDGLYALISTVDPTQKLLEGDITNNTAVIYFQLQGNQINLLGKTLGEFQEPRTTRMKPK